MRSRLLALIRLLGFATLLVWAAIEFAFLVWPFRRNESAARAALLQRLTRRLVRLFNIGIEVVGDPSPIGMVACNHLSYLDILVLGQAAPLIFVSKSEVAAWPGIGLITKLTGTLFIDRARRSDVARVGALCGRAVAAGTSVVIFPEGTSSDGGQILPFLPSLFESAAASSFPVIPAHIGYDLEVGSVREEVCYWGTMSFAPHLFNLLSKPSIHARLSFGNPITGADRKEIAKAARDEVIRLKNHAYRHDADTPPIPANYGHDAGPAPSNWMKARL